MAFLVRDKLFHMRNARDIGSGFSEGAPFLPMSDRFTLKFEGEPHEIDAVTLGHSLLDVAKIVQAAARETSPELKADVKVTAHAPGSFEVLFTLDLLADPSGLWGDAVKAMVDATTIVAGLLGSVIGALQLHKMLKGEPPKEVTPVVETQVAAASQSVQITMPDNSTIVINQTIVNVYNSEEFQHSAPHLFDTLEQNEAVEGLTIEEGPTPETPERENRVLFTASRSEFSSLTGVPAPILLPASSESEDANVRVRRLDGQLQLLRVHFQRRHRWAFLWEGFEVSGTVEDDEFWRKFDAYEIKVGVGVTLDATFEFTQRRDPAKSNAYITDKRSFRVVEVRDVIPPPTQLLLDGLL